MKTKKALLPIMVFLGVIMLLALLPMRTAFASEGKVMKSETLVISAADEYGEYEKTGESEEGESREEEGEEGEESGGSEGSEESDDSGESEGSGESDYYRYEE